MEDANFVHCASIHVLPKIRFDVFDYRTCPVVQIYQVLISTSLPKIIEYGSSQRVKVRRSHASEWPLEQSDAENFEATSSLLVDFSLPAFTSCDFKASMSAANNATELQYLLFTNQCTLALCPLEYAFIHYDPDLIGNAFYTGLFGLLLLLQIGLGIRYKTWSFTAGMCSGLVLEVIGYIGRILMHNDPFSDNNFLIYIICLTIGPAFFSAAIYLCLARIVVMYGEDLSRVTPRTYTITFVTCDIIALVLQATGGGFANTDSGTMGTHIMVAGLSFQVASLLLFIALSLEFAWRVWSHINNRSLNHAEIRQTKKFKYFLAGLALATLCILARSCFRVAELSKGFDSALANDQVTFMILEGGLISIACITLTALHAGPAFQEAWNTANFKLRKVKKGRELKRKDWYELKDVKSVGYMWERREA